MNEQTPLRLMAIFAHPDDESLGIGGTLARYTAEGVEVTLITATRGQRGWFGEPTKNPGLDALGQLREGELRSAASALGIRELVLLNYLDGDLNQADPERITCELVGHIRRLRPHVVVTFGPDGAYGHPDHMAISQFTTTATVQSANPKYGHRCATRAPHAVSKLYYMTVSATHADLYTHAFGDISMLIDGVERRMVIAPDWLINARIDAGEHWRTAWQAIQSHRSQLPNYARLMAMSDADQRRLWSVNNFYRAFSTVNGGPAVEDDLFAGLRAPGAELARAA
jgi:LmbE family N-acetylglucosaminyl deacetylase